MDKLREAGYIRRGADGEYLNDVGQCGFTCDHVKPIRPDGTDKSLYLYCTKLGIRVEDYDSCKYFCNDKHAALIWQMHQLLTEEKEMEKNAAMRAKKRKKSKVLWVVLAVIALFILWKFVL